MPTSPLRDCDIHCAAARSPNPGGDWPRPALLFTAALEIAWNACPQDQSSSMVAGCAAKTLCPAAIDEHSRTPADCNQRIPPGSR